MSDQETWPGVDSRSADTAYATKPNIVRAPEDAVHERVLAGEDVSIDIEQPTAVDAVIRDWEEPEAEVEATHLLALEHGDELVTDEAQHGSDEE